MSWDPTGKDGVIRVGTEASGFREINISDVDYKLERVKKGEYEDMWRGGFLGMSDKGMEALKSALGRFLKELQDVADAFNENGSIEMAFQGSVKDSVQRYIASIKELIKAYITIINNGIKDADNAYANWIEKNTAISSNVEDETQSIRSQAESIKVD